MKKLTSSVLSQSFRLARTGLGLALVFAACSAPAYAWTNTRPPVCPPPTHGGAVPEIDPSSIAGALTLLSGGALLLADKFRRK